MRIAVLLASAGAIMAGPVDDKVNAALARVKTAGVIRTAAGVTRSGAAIPALLTRDDLDYSTRKTRVLLVGAMDGAAGSTDAVLAAMAKPGSFAVSAVPVANPEAFAKGGGAAVSGFPPSGEHYGGKDNAEAQYLWRWIGMHAPDVVVVIGAGGGLAEALASNKASGTGTIPAFELPVDRAASALAEVRKRGIRGPSPARAEIQRRLARQPLEVARQLAEVYGKELPEAVYIPAVALMARLRLGEATRDASQLSMVEKIVEPYFSGAKDSMAKPTGSHLSGHLLFGELFAATKKPRYLELVRKAADTGFDKGGAPLESMPMHMEMSDSVFMGCPIVAQAGRLTGDRKYFDMALRHMRFMLKLNLRQDGLHRHSPLDETAWGRGNGFPALGLALTLSELPASFEGRAEVLAAFRAHIAAMLPHQDPGGAWHQVVDHPESYRELTVTSMMLFAMRRGVERGWLDKAKYQSAIDRAWYAIKTRVAADGSLVDVCTGTGKQKSLRDYYDRGAILGPDPRGGAMAFLAAMEMVSPRR